MDEKCMCYITYAVPRNMMGEFMGGELSGPTPRLLYPPGFEPDWFRKSSFPEDDIDE